MKNIKRKGYGLLAGALLGLAILMTAAAGTMILTAAPVETEAAGLTLKTPTLTKTKVYDTKIRVYWDAVPSASSYMVYRKGGADTKYQQVGEVTGTTFDDKDILPGRAYTYTVRASAVYKGNTVTGSYSKEGITAIAKIASVEPKILSVKSTKIKVGWKTQANVSGYLVYRKERSGTYVLMKQIKSNTTSSWTDSSVVRGHLYTYTVRAYVDDNGAIRQGDYDKTGVSAQYAVKIPTMVSTTSVSGHVVISWERTSGVDGYYVYRKKGSGEWKKLAKITNTTMNYMWDTSAVVGGKYSYAIRGYVVDCGTIVKSEPYYMDGSVTVAPEAPVMCSVRYYSSTKDYVTWTTVAGAENYTLYKKSDATSGKWVAYKTVDAGTKTTRSLKVARDAGVTQYSVRASLPVGSKTVYSARSDSLDNDDRYFLNTSILFDGDSITWGYTWNKAQALVNYPERISQLLGCSYMNVGVSNATVAKRYSSDAKSLVVRATSQSSSYEQTDYTGYDVICIAAGTNDYNYNIPLGEENDTSVTTFYGAWNTIFKRIRKENPTAKVVLITPSYRGRIDSDFSKVGMKCTNAIGLTLGDYCEAEKNVAARYGAVVYDSSKMGVIDASNYMSATYDALHPTRETYGLMGTSIAEFLAANVLEPDVQVEYLTADGMAVEPETADAEFGMIEEEPETADAEPRMTEAEAETDASDPAPETDVQPEE